MIHAASALKTLRESSFFPMKACLLDPSSEHSGSQTLLGLRMMPRLPSANLAISFAI